MKVEHIGLGGRFDLHGNIPDAVLSGVLIRAISVPIQTDNLDTLTLESSNHAVDLIPQVTQVAKVDSPFAPTALPSLKPSLNPVRSDLGFHIKDYTHTREQHAGRHSLVDACVGVELSLSHSYPF